MSQYLLILHDAKDGSQAGRAELRECLCTTLRVSEAKAVEIVSSLPSILCQGLTQRDAERFARVLEHLGAVVEVMEAPDAGIGMESALSFIAPASGNNGSTSSESLETAPTLAPSNASVEENFPLQLDPQPSAELGTRSGSLETLFEPELTGLPPRELPDGVGEDVVEELSTLLPANPLGDEVQDEAAESLAHRAFAAGLPPDSVSECLQPFRSEGGSNSPARLGRPRFMALGVAAAGAALLIGFPWLSLRPEPELHITIDVARLLAEQASIMGKDGQKAPPEKLVSYQGRADQPPTHSSVELYIGASGVHGGRIQIDRDEPPLLTLEELAKGTPLPIFLSRVEGVLTRAEEGTDAVLEVPEGAQLLRGTLRAYLGDISGNNRVILRGTVVVWPAAAEGTARRVTWDARSSGIADQEAAPILRRSSQKSGYDVLLRGEVLADIGTALVRSPTAAQPTNSSPGNQSK